MSERDDVDRLAARFHALFEGLERAHGKTQTSGRRDPRKGKVEARSLTVREPVTDELWKQHLAGDYGLGVIPITDESTVRWGAIDIDKYGLDLSDLERQVRELNLPIVVCRTKSGGAHLFLFASEQVDAKLMRDRLTDVAVALGYPGVEVFPKQLMLASRDDVGSWLNMPYVGGLKGEATRYAILDGEAVDAWTFADLAEAQRSSAEVIEAIEPDVSSEFEDGPPCLQQLSTHGFPEGTRNNSLFNLGVYARLKYPDDWKSKVEEYNHRLVDPPLASEEVQAVVKSLQRKDYRYTCLQPPIVHACNRGLCLGRRYGIAGGGADEETQDVQIGGLWKHLTDPPFFVVDVDGYRLELSASELLDHKKFQLRCVESLNKLPPDRKAATWKHTVQALLSQCEEVEPPPDASPEGRLMELVEEFCTRFASGEQREDLLQGMPIHDGGWTYFRSRDLESFLERQGYRDFRGKRLYQLLRDKGRDGSIRHRTFNVNGQCVRTWGVPRFREEDGPLEAPAREDQGY